MKDLKDMNRDELKAWLDSSTQAVNLTAYEKSSAEVHFFKDSGKWYTTEVIPWVKPGAPGSSGSEALISEQFVDSLAQALWLNDDARFRYQGMLAVCIDGPAGYPITVKVGEW